MGKIITAVMGLKEKARDAILRFPATILCILVSYCMIDIDRYTYIKIPDRLAVVMIYAVILAIILEMVLENLRQNSVRFRLICYSGLLALLTALYFIVNANSEKNLYVIFALCVLAIVTLKSEKRGLFEKNLLDLIKNSFLSFMFSSIFCGGVLALLGSISLLLVRVNTDFYTETLLISYMILFPIIFLGSIPKIGQTIEYPKFIKNLLKFVILPLSIAFTVVLYLYYIKVFAFNNELLEAMLEISVVFLIIVIYTLILSKPFEEKIFKYSRKYMPYTLIPIIGVLIYGTVENILQSGIKYDEYFYIISALWATVSIVLIIIKEGKFQYINFYIVAVMSIISAFGPISVDNIVSRSQQHILTTTLNKYNMIKNNKVVANEKLSKADEEKIRDAIKCLKINKLKMPSYYDEKNEVISEILENTHFGLYNYSRYQVEKEIINTSGYDYYMEATSYNRVETIEQGKFEYKKSLKEIKVLLNDVELLSLSNKDVQDAIYKKIKNKKSDDEYNIKCNQDELSYEYENEKIKAKIIYKEMTYEDGKFAYGYSIILFSFK